MKPKLKLLGTKRLKLLHYEPPSNVAFEFNRRRYNELHFALINYMILHSYLRTRIGTTNNSQLEVGRCRLSR
jgi:hypothetical protein